MKKLLFTSILLLLTLAVLACSAPEPSQPIVKKQPEENMLHVEPVDLFAGEASKFKPFLGLMSGAVKLKYTGNKQEINAEVELWENGVKTKTVGKVGTMIQDSQEGKKVFEGEFIVSIREVNLDGSKPQYEITSSIADKDGSSSIVSLIERNPKMTGWLGSIQLNKSLTVSENNKVAVWGIQATDENTIDAIELTSEDLKKVKWALVFVLSLEK